MTATRALTINEYWKYWTYWKNCQLTHEKRLPATRYFVLVGFRRL